MIRLLPIVLMLSACGDAKAPLGPDARASLSPDDVRSGYTFLQPETQALQDDDFANPSFLWIDRGKALFAEAIEDGQACSSCHGADGADLEGAAAHYPAIDEESGELVNMEGRINFCRKRYQDREPLDYESDELLALTAYVASLSRDVPMSVDISGAAESWYQTGEDYFFTRRGQFNLSCNQCHNENWGRKLRGDTISQGHGNAFPAYRLEWQSLGSLQRRLRDCDSGVRAEPLAYGSDTYKAVELYLAKRAEGLPMESPGVRR